MKFQSATSSTGRNRGAYAFAQSTRENALLAAGVALAFLFVTSCIFMLG